jgi:hypothetical protein
VVFDIRPEAATLLPELEIMKKDPSGPAFVPDSDHPFVTDGGPTLAPSDTTADLSGTDPEVKEISES